VAQAAAARQTATTSVTFWMCIFSPEIRLVVQRDDSAPHAVLTMQRAAAVEKKGNTRRLSRCRRRPEGNDRRSKRATSKDVARRVGRGANQRNS
jgi:hypothetical protein